MEGRLDQREWIDDAGARQERHVAAAVVQPGTVDELQEVVARAYAAGTSIVPRGGGMSYSRGYEPQRVDSILVDMRRLNRIEFLDDEVRAKRMAPLSHEFKDIKEGPEGPAPVPTHQAPCRRER